jgi:hypothetical protein
VEPFDIEEASVGVVDGIFTLGLRGSSEAESLVFQLAKRFDEQDTLLELDCYSISTGAGGSVYGGVTGVRVGDLLLTVTLAPG